MGGKILAGLVCHQIIIYLKIVLGTLNLSYSRVLCCFRSSSLLPPLRKGLINSFTLEFKQLKSLLEFSVWHINKI